MTKSVVYLTPMRPGAVGSLHWARAYKAMIPVWGHDIAQNLPEDDEGMGVAAMRNLLVASSFKQAESRGIEIAYFAWLDDDVIPLSITCWRALHNVMKRYGADISSGVYFTKEEFPSPLIFDGPNRPRQFVPDQDYLAWGAGMGLTLVKAEVYLRMMRELQLPLDKNGNPEWYHADAAGGHVPDELIGHQGPVNFSEDINFYTNAAKLGMKVAIDTSRHSFGFHCEVVAHGRGFKTVVYPQKQWQQYRIGQPIAWEVNGQTTEWRTS